MIFYNNKNQENNFAFFSTNMENSLFYFKNYKIKKK